MAQALFHLHVSGDFVDGHMTWPLDHHLHAALPSADGELSQLDDFGGLGGIVGVVETSGAAGVAQADGDVVLVADVEHLVIELVEGVLVTGDFHPAKEQRPSAAHDVHEAAGLLEGLDDGTVDARMDGYEVHAVLGVCSYGCQQVVLGELDERFFHIADGVVHRNGSHHKRSFVNELLAELAGLARVGEVHDGVGAQVFGDLHLLPLLGGVCLVAGDTEVDVYLCGKALAHTKGAHALFDMDDVRGDGDAAVGDALANVFGVTMFALGDFFHLRSDLPGTRVIHLRDKIVGLVFGHE